MKLLLVLTLLCIHNPSLPCGGKKQKPDTVKKAVKPVKFKKGSAPLYPSVLIVNTF